MNNTGSPADLHCTPWYTEGRNPLPQADFPASGFLPPEARTINPGKFSFSDPKPYETHEPKEGRPNLAEPVCMSNWAGAWLN